MSDSIDKIRKTRLFLLKTLTDLTVCQVNKIPNGFNNNIIWNLGHLISVQQRLCYRRSGLPMVVPEDFFLAHESGSRPQHDVSAAEMENIKKNLLTSLDRFEADYQKGLFVNYEPFTTRSELTLKSVEEAVTFLLFHEGLHFGTISAMKRLV